MRRLRKPVVKKVDEEKGVEVNTTSQNLTEEAIVVVDQSDIKMINPIKETKKPTSAEIWSTIDEPID